MFGCLAYIRAHSTGKFELDKVKYTSTHNGPQCREARGDGSDWDASSSDEEIEQAREDEEEELHVWEEGIEVRQRPRPRARRKKGRVRRRMFIHAFCDRVQQVASRR